MTRPRKPQITLADKMRAHLRARELGKRHYERADRLLEEILCEVDCGRHVKLGDNKVAVVVDNFAEKNKVYRAHGIARYEVHLEALPLP